MLDICYLLRKDRYKRLLTSMLLHQKMYTVSCKSMRKILLFENVLLTALYGIYSLKKWRLRRDSNP